MILQHQPRVHRPSLADVARFSNVGTVLDEVDKLQLAPSCMVASVGCAATGGLSGWEPTDLGSAVSDWDMVTSTITKSGANITQIDDLIGSNNLTVPGADNPPLDVTSDGDLGRRSCQFDQSNTESLAVTISLEAQPLTLWWIGTLDAIATFNAIFGCDVADTYFQTSGPDEWVMEDTSFTFTTNTTAPAVDTPVLIVFVLNGTSSEVYVNNVAEGMAPAAFTASSILQVVLGNNLPGDHSDTTFTRAGLTGESMISGDRTELYDWAVAKCNV